MNVLTDYSIIKKYISANRLRKYELVCNNDYKKALKLYQTNVRLSQAFYPLLSMIEIIIRNALNEELSIYFNDKDWLQNQINGFMNDHKLVKFDRNLGRNIFDNFLQKSVQNSVRDLGVKVSQNNIIADLKFGYWTKFYSLPCSKVLKNAPMKIFTNAPHFVGRNTINGKLNAIRDFRNRVYHNEPIIFDIDSSGNVIFNLDKSYQIYEDTKLIFEWLNLDFNKWTKRINNVPFELERAKHVIDKYPSKKYYYYRIKIGITHYKKKYLQ